MRARVSKLGFDGGMKEIDRKYLDSQIKEIRDIYGILGPDEAFEVFLCQKNDRLNLPCLLPVSEPLNPEVLSGDYIGAIHVGPAGQIPRRRAIVELAKDMSPADLTESYMPWNKRGRRARAVFDLSPVLFEQAKYLVERWRASRVTSNYPFDPYSHRNRAALRDLGRERDRSKPPAILIGFHFLEVGGAEKLAFDSVHWALEAGLRVFIIANVQGPQRAISKLPDDERVRFFRTDQYLPRSQMQEFLVNLVAQENIVITHNHHCNALYDALPALTAHFGDLVHLDSTHIVEHTDGGYPRISGRWSDYIDMHHVISQDLIDYHKAHFQNPHKLVLGRLLDRGQKTAEDRQINLTDGQKTCRVAFVGRMVHQKRPVLAVEIMKRLARWGRSEGISFQFDVVGEGPYREAVSHLVEKYGLSDLVTLHLSGADVPGLLSRSDIMILPSSNEGLALVCYEAIENGALPITTNVGGQGEIVPKDLLVDPSPIRTIAQTVALVKKLLKDRKFKSGVWQEAARKFDTLRAEALAKDVIMPEYLEAASR